MLEEGEYDTLSEDDKQLVLDIPSEYRNQFSVDIMNAMRDIAGVGTISKHPYLMNAKAVQDSFTDRPSVLSREATDFDKLQLEVYPDNITHARCRRWVHVDLAFTGDSAGIVCGFIEKFVTVDRGGVTEMYPKIIIDFALEVIPPLGGEILAWKIRDLLYTLRDKAGMPIQWVTMDSFQSFDMLQTLRKNGFVAGLQSMDKTMHPYEVLKGCIYDGLLTQPKHHKLVNELRTIEYLPKEGKVDHPAKFSKDVADALAGVVYGLSTRTELWIEAGIPVYNIPRVFTFGGADMKDAGLS